MTASDARTDDDAELLALASRLTEQADRGGVKSLTRLAGGRNNQVYRLETENGPALVLKRYFSDPRDSRDRLGTEWNFIHQAWSRGIRLVPEPLAFDTSRQAGLYGFVQGRKLAASEVTQAHVDAALDFVLAINQQPRPALALASEACFSLSEHEATVERRVARLARIDEKAPHAGEARSLVSERLVPAWEEIKSRLVTDAHTAGLSMDELIGRDDCCISPSDFGFHNALLGGDGRLTFLDFEYSGCDDPAKLACDFFCQVAVPVPLSLHSRFIDRLAKGLSLDAATVARCRLLLDAYRIKWTCIVLNDFVPLDSARRAFASEGDRAIRCADQLAKAGAILAEIEAAIS